MRRAANLSNLLAAALIPLCAWGLIATLMLHLIEVRSVFVAGGEGRLRQGILAFAFGVVLVQRLSRLEGRSIATAYGYALGAAMTLFAVHQAYAYRIPGIHPIFVFLANAVLFAILAWAGNAITAACSVDSECDLEGAAESGILYRVSREWRQLQTEKPPDETAGEKEWAERLPRRHPGRVIFYFSLVAVPLFALGVLLFGEDRLFARARAGVFLFTYLWCAFALLSLSHLRQLSVYFVKRGVSLPEMIGLTWLSIAGIITVAVLVAAVLLPQPPSLSGYFVRERVLSVYHGWSSKHGMKDTVAGKPGGGGAGGAGGAEGERSFAGEAEAADKLETRMQNIDKMGDRYLSEMARNTGWEAHYRKAMTGIGKMNDGFRKFFDLLLKGLFVVLILCCPVVLFMLIGGAWQSLWAKTGGRLRFLRKQMRERLLEKEKKKKERAEDLERRRYYGVRDPFAPYIERDGDELVRICWEALLAFCADYGTPCAPSQTPLEFVGAGPEALAGFEEHAHFIASLFTFSEFSGQPVSDAVRPALKEFWGNLERHAQKAGV